MSRRPPRQARFLGLWTAAWLAVLLLAGLVLAGDLTVQWPVLAVPLLWALVALRPRRGRAPVRDDDEPGFWDDDDRYADRRFDDDRRPTGPWSPGPQPLPTRETQVLPPLPPRTKDPYRREWPPR